jgi:hypothetical protein
VKRVSVYLAVLMSVWIGGCETVTDSSQTTIANVDSASQNRFASGLKAVKIITSVNSGGSFATPAATPVLTPIPSPWPGSNEAGTTQYLPGVSPTTLYDLDGTTPILKPSWLRDFQLGITSTSASSSCATFGGSGSADASGFYRVSERNCGSVANGIGDSGSDPVFFRVVLDRDFTKFGSAENLLVQVEYQANGLRPNTDLNGNPFTNPEDGLDQLWKIFTNTSLALGSAGNPLSLFVPPNFAFCSSGGTGNGPNACTGNPTGAPVTVRQFLIPLSANPDISVVQFSRIKSRVNASGTGNYVNTFCTSNDSPMCLGLVIRSVTLMRF